MSASHAPFNVSLYLVPNRMQDDCPWHPSGPVACAHCGYAVMRRDVARFPTGTHVAGLAPIGIRWGATVRNGRIRPDKGCPPGEFAPVAVQHNGTYYPVLD